MQTSLLCPARMFAYVLARGDTWLSLIWQVSGTVSFPCSSLISIISTQGKIVFSIMVNESVTGTVLLIIKPYVNANMWNKQHSSAHNDLCEKVFIWVCMLTLLEEVIFSPALSVKASVCLQWPTVFALLLVTPGFCRLRVRSGPALLRACSVVRQPPPATFQRAAPPDSWRFRINFRITRDRSLWKPLICWLQAGPLT